MAGLEPRVFYRKWLGATFAPAFKRTGVINLVLSVGLAFAAWKWPPLSSLSTTLRWVIPVAAFGSFFVYQAFRAPLEFVQEGERQLDAAQQRVALAEAELQDTRNCQAIADFLTKEQEYGVHKILHEPPKTAEDLMEWNRWVANWNTALFARMRQLECTPQEINYVETISILDVTDAILETEPAAHGGGGYQPAWVQKWNKNAAEAARTAQIPFRMHDIRCRRVAEIATKYANRAEEIRLAATKRILAT